MTTTPQFLTLVEAANMLRTSPKTIRRRIADGSLTGYRVGPAQLRVEAAEVAALARPIPTARAV